MDREWLENYISMARECEHRQERLARMKSAEVLPPAASRKRWEPAHGKFR